MKVKDKNFPGETNKDLKLNFEYFIKMAMQDKITWDTLIVFLEDLTPTLDKSKQANIVLVKELQKMHQKLQEKGADDDFDVIEIKPTENSERCFEKLPRNHSNVIKSGNAVSEIGHIKETNELMIPDKNAKNQNQIQEEIAIKFESELIQQGNSKDQPTEVEIIQLEEDEGPEQEPQFIENPDLQNDQQLSLQINGEECLSQIEDLTYPLDDEKQIDEVTKAKEVPKQIVKSRTTKKQYNCKVCNVVFKQMKALKNHAKDHPDKSILKSSMSGIKCGTCKKRFRRFNDLKFHEAIHTRGTESEQTEKCYVCDKTFTNVPNLRKHEYYHHQKPNDENHDHACKSCGIIFNDKRSLLKHKTIRHAEKPFQCQLCHKTFARKDNLHSHLNSHSNRFKCVACSKCFATKQNLQRHDRIHTGEKPFKCSTCQKEFRTHSDHTNHVRIHTGEKPFSCMACHERFRIQADLKLHMKIH